MKKIIQIFLVFILLSQISFAIEDNFDEIKNEETLEQPIILEPEERYQEEISPYSKDALKGIIEKDYDINSPEGMFKEQLKLNIKKGIIKDANAQINIQNNISHDWLEEETKYNMQLINIGLKGKFRSEKEGYNFLFDATPMHDNFWHRFVLDAWVETNRIPHHTLMFGTSRPMVGFEGGQSPYTLPFISRSQTARNYGNIRRTGVRLKGNYKYVDYDIGGYSSDTWYSEFLPGVESDIWVNFKPLANTKGKYGNLNLAGGIALGARNAQDFTVTTAALSYDYKKFWMRAEFANADGSNGASGITEKQRWGYNLTLAYRITKKLEALLRFDDFDNDKNISNNNTKEYTAGINYYVLGQCARIIVNYVFCQNDAKKDSHKLIVGTQFLL